MTVQSVGEKVSPEVLRAECDREVCLRVGAQLGAMDREKRVNTIGWEQTFTGEVMGTRGTAQLVRRYAGGYGLICKGEDHALVEDEGGTWKEMLGTHDRELQQIGTFAKLNTYVTA